MNELNDDRIRQSVRQQYARVAEARESSAGQNGCCGGDTRCCGSAAVGAETTSMNLGYSREQVSEIPDGANMGLGCGNPQAIASLKRGETVLDLGSGGGFDCFLAARQVGESGRVIGVDMTPEMISKARANADKGAYPNVEFRLGEIEALPIADASVDVIISNCVINLSPDKSRVFREAHRVLKPGGRLAISDVVTAVGIPEALREDMDLFAGCQSGAATITEITAMLHQAGFTKFAIEPKEESKAFIREWQPDSRLDDVIVSATIQAIKPALSKH